MGILRIILVLGLVAGCAYLALRTPWTARLAPSATTMELADAPFWAPPEKPQLNEFPGFVKTPEIPREEGINITIDTGVEIVVEVNRRLFFGRACGVIVGLFLLFGIVGTIIQRRPETSDVAFSLWLSLGMSGGILASATVGHLGGQGSLPHLSVFLLVGFVVGLSICIRSQIKPPLPKQKGKGGKKSTAT